MLESWQPLTWEHWSLSATDLGKEVVQAMQLRKCLVIYWISLSLSYLLYIPGESMRLSSNRTYPSGEQSLKEWAREPASGTWKKLFDRELIWRRKEMIWHRKEMAPAVDVQEGDHTDIPMMWRLQSETQVFRVEVDDSKREKDCKWEEVKSLLVGNSKRKPEALAH